jgi:Nickel responsive protein SCO4226-like
MNTYIVERDFGKPVGEADLAATLDRMAPCLEEYGLNWVQSYFSQDRTRMMCVYEGKDAESVRGAQRSAEAHFDKVWQAETLRV